MSEPKILMGLSFDVPPLTANQRMCWQEKAPIVRNVRREARVKAQFLKLVRMEKVEVKLHYRPRDNRRRDADNLIPTLKALCDGLVDAGVVPDDTPEFMVKHMPIIHPKDGPKAAMWLEINEWKQEDETV